MKYSLPLILAALGLWFLQEPESATVAGPRPCESQQYPDTPQPVLPSVAPSQLRDDKPAAVPFQPPAPKPSGAAEVPQTAKDSPAPLVPDAPVSVAPIEGWDEAWERFYKKYPERRPPPYPLYPGVPKKGPAYVEPNTPANWYRHLCDDHGFDRAWVMWLHRQPAGAKRLEALHGDAHNECVQQDLVVYRTLPHKPTTITVAKAKTVAWLRDAEARKSGKPILYYVTLSRGCPYCEVMDRHLANPIVVNYLERFACVKVVDPPRPGAFVNFHRIRLFPSMRIFSPDMKKVATINGCPPGGIPELLGMLDSGLRHINGKPPGPARNLQSLLPTLAAPMPPAMKEKVEGPQHSVVTVGPRVPAGDATGRRGRQAVSRQWTLPSAGTTQRIRGRRQ